MSLQAEVYEALNGALYRFTHVDATLLGETDVSNPDDGPMRVAWWHIGEAPKDLRVAIILPTSGKDEVRVRVEWRNYFADGRAPLKCEQTLSISTYASTAEMLFPVTEKAILRILAIYDDVLAEQGVAGPIEALAPETEEEDSDG